MAPAPNESDIPDKENTKQIQSIVGTLLYYARSVDTAMLQEINEISRVKSKPTKDTDTKASMLLDYASTYQNAAIWYQASDMVLHEDSDASYLTMREAWSCYAGIFYLSDWPSYQLVKPYPKRKRFYPHRLKDN